MCERRTLSLVERESPSLSLARSSARRSLFLFLFFRLSFLFSLSQLVVVLVSLSALPASSLSCRRLKSTTAANCNNYDIMRRQRLVRRGTAEGVVTSLLVCLVRPPRPTSATAVYRCRTARQLHGALFTADRASFSPRCCRRSSCCCRCYRCYCCGSRSGGCSSGGRKLVPLPRRRRRPPPPRAATVFVTQPQ